MKADILITYKSVTGFTRDYAEMIAGSLNKDNNCALMDLKEVTAEGMSGFDTVIFGGRMHAGTVDGLKKAKELYGNSKASRFIVFATGAMPNIAESTIEEMWRNNLTGAELSDFPHFYMQGGLWYERMPFMEKILMKTFAGIMKRKMKKKKDKDEMDRQFEEMIAKSYDISDKEYIRPLVECVEAGK